MREPLLERNPDIHPVTLAVLVGIAAAIERESVRRYALLVQSMQRRGDAAAAAALGVMLEEERAHVGAVERWAASLREPLPPEGEFERRLPAELWKSWDDVAGSARLTPYRAFAIAVDSERRAFALYSYLAAEATDPRVAAQAERLALEELRHAALLRRFRRQAWHRERRAMPDTTPLVASESGLHALLAQREAAILARHRDVAARLRAVGDDASAALIEQVTAIPAWPAAGDVAPAPLASDCADPVRLLVAAQEPLEALSEELESVLRTSDGELFAAAEKALVNVVSRLARIALQREHRMQSG